MRYKIIQLVLLVPAGDESAVEAIDDHAIDHTDQLVAWGRAKLTHEDGSLTQAEAEDQFRRLTGKTPSFRAELDDE